VKLILINLLAEEEQAAKARAKDPFRLLIAISAWLLVAVVLLGGLFSGLVLRSGAEMRSLEQQLKELNKQQASGNIGSFQLLKQSADDFIALNQSRKLYAPQLAAIKDLVPSPVQILRISLTTSAVVPVSSGDAKAKLAAPLHETMFLQLEGKVSSARPENDVAEFQRILETNPKFGAQVKLRSYGRASSPTERGGVVVGQFVIECQYKEQP